MQICISKKSMINNERHRLSFIARGENSTNWELSKDFLARKRQKRETYFDTPFPIFPQ